MVLPAKQEDNRLQKGPAGAQTSKSFWRLFLTPSCLAMLVYYVTYLAWVRPKALSDYVGWIAFGLSIGLLVALPRFFGRRK